MANKLQKIKLHQCSKWYYS